MIILWVLHSCNTQYAYLGCTELLVYEAKLYIYNLILLDIATQNIYKSYKKFMKSKLLYLKLNKEPKPSRTSDSVS